MSVQNGGPVGAFRPRFPREKSVPAYQAVLSAADGKKAPAWNMKDMIRTGTHAYARWMKRRSSRLAISLHFVKEPSATQYIQQGKVMCKEYVFSRLRSSGLMTTKLEKEAPQRPSDISLEIQTIGDQLEQMYPDLYRHLSRQLNTTFSSAQIVQDTYRSLATEMFKDGNITWGRVVALFSLAAGFAIDCVGQGHSVFVTEVVEAFTKFVSQRLVNWISAQGGWVDVVRTFRASKDTSTLWLLSAFGAIFGFAATLFSAVDL